VIVEPVSVFGDLHLRRPCPEDRAALEAMFKRCSLQTIYRRFHGRVRAFPRAYLEEALAGVAEHYAVIAANRAEAAALASCRAADRPGEAELGILIEDDWQWRGLGGVLLERLMTYADSAGIGVLRVQLLTEQDWITDKLGRYGSCSSAFRRGVREVTLWRSRHIDSDRGRIGT
jgi:GNAT superfamily N-acetyltransferase